MASLTAQNRHASNGREGSPVRSRRRTCRSCPTRPCACPCVDASTLIDHLQLAASSSAHRPRCPHSNMPGVAVLVGAVAIKVAELQVAPHAVHDEAGLVCGCLGRASDYVEACVRVEVSV